MHVLYVIYKELSSTLSSWTPSTWRYISVRQASCWYGFRLYCTYLPADYVKIYQKKLFCYGHSTDAVLRGVIWRRWGFLENLGNSALSWINSLRLYKKSGTSLSIKLVWVPPLVSAAQPKSTNFDKTYSNYASQSSIYRKYIHRIDSTFNYVTL